MKYARTYHLPFSPGATSDDRISHSVDSLLNIPVIITEKLDGSNTTLERYGVFGRSHAAHSENAWDRPMWDIWQRIKLSIDLDTYIFGENMYGIHSIEYSNLKSYFYMFGVRDGEIWVPWSTVEEYSFLLDLPTTPVLFNGIITNEKELRSTVEELSQKESILGGKREGIVIRKADAFHNDDFSTSVMKWVRKGHVQTDVHWTKNWKKAKLNDEK
jgi:hypothetical protein